MLYLAFEYSIDIVGLATLMYLCTFYFAGGLGRLGGGVSIIILRRLLEHLW